MMFGMAVAIAQAVLPKQIVGRAWAAADAIRRLPNPPTHSGSQ